MALCFERQDHSIWKFNNSGLYIVKSFSTLISGKQASQVEHCHIFANLWRGVAPPRVELMVWFVLLNSLSTMDRLRKFNILQRNSYWCVLCDLEDETNDHLSIHYSSIWEV